MTEKPRLADILQQLPSLRKLLGEFGDISLFDYAKNNYRPVPSNAPLFLERKKEFIDFLRKYLNETFDADISTKACESLERNYVVSTAEHHGPIGHPFWFQSDILRGLVDPGNTIINLCTSHVSLGNSSYPRGIVFHGDGDKAPIDYLKLPFFPASQRMDPVFRHPAFTRDDIEKTTLPKLKSYLEADSISQELFERITNFLKSYVGNEQILNCKTYSEQITGLNHSWWSQILPSLPDFIPLDAEDIVSELLMKHLANDTILTKIITDIALQPIIEENFDGISCCFDLEKKSGTYLFWYLDENNNRSALWRDGENLVSKENEICIPLNAQSVIQYLSSGQLIPSGLLTYTTLACYYGITCFGGFAQGNYLPKIQTAYDSILNEENKINLSTQGSILNEDMVFLFEKNNEISTAFDMWSYDRMSTDEMIKKAKNISLTDSFEKMVSEIARCL